MHACTHEREKSQTKIGFLLMDCFECQVVSVSTKSVLVRWKLWSGRRLTKQHRLRVKTAPIAAVLASDASSSASAYEVSQRLIREAPWRDAGLVSGTTSEYAISGLDGSMQVQVQVAARNDAGWGIWSQSALSETLPMQPTLVFIQEVRAEEIELKWTPPAGAQLEYSIVPMLWEEGMYRDQPAAIKNAGTLDSHRVKPLLKGRKYIFRVAVLKDVGDGDGGGVGDYSALSNDVTTLSTVPSEGPVLYLNFTSADQNTPAPVTADSLRLRWNPVVAWQESGGTSKSSPPCARADETCSIDRRGILVAARLTILCIGFCSHYGLRHRSKASRRGRMDSKF